MDPCADQAVAAAADAAARAVARLDADDADGASGGDAPRVSARPRGANIADVDHDAEAMFEAMKGALSDASDVPVSDLLEISDGIADLSADMGTLMGMVARIDPRGSGAGIRGEMDDLRAQLLALRELVEIQGASLGALQDRVGAISAPAPRGPEGGR